jgi:hypothetical protein
MRHNRQNSVFKNGNQIRFLMGLTKVFYKKKDNNIFNKIDPILRTIFEKQLNSG